VIPEQRLREIAAADPVTVSYDTVRAIATELLAARSDKDMAEGEADHALDGEWFADLCDAIRMLRNQRDAARAENERMAKQRDELVKACTAKDDLLACYRIGKRPSETLFKRLDKAKKVLDAIAAEQPKPAGGGA